MIFTLFTVLHFLNLPIDWCSLGQFDDKQPMDMIPLDWDSGSKGAIHRHPQPSASHASWQSQLENPKISYPMYEYSYNNTYSVYWCTTYLLLCSDVPKILTAYLLPTCRSPLLFPFFSFLFFLLIHAASHLLSPAWTNQLIWARWNCGLR